MFKVGQKVVFIGLTEKPSPDLIIPQINEVVTVHCFCSVYDNSIDISEYLATKIGGPQSFKNHCFRPLDETFREETIAMLNEHFETLKITV